MASGDSDRDAEYALSKLLQMGTVAKYQMEFEMLIKRVTGISESLLKSFYISGLKPALQCVLLRSNPKTLEEAFSLALAAEARFTHLQLWEFLRSNPSTLGETFFKTRITEARFEVIAKKVKKAYQNELTARVHVQDLKQTTQGRGNEPNRILLATIHHMIYPITVEVLHQVFSPLGSGDTSRRRVDSGHSSTLSSLVEHVSLRAMVIGRPYQGVGGSPEEASWEWMSNSHTPWAKNVRRRKRLKCYVQGSGRRKKKKGIDSGSGRRDYALFGASVFSPLNPSPGSFSHRRIWDPKIKSAFPDITLRARWFRRSREGMSLY
ncbi:hypothetical protein Tco_0646974 [Tanacetum coccineum]